MTNQPTVAAPAVVAEPITATPGGDLLEDRRDFTHNEAPWYARHSLGENNTRIYSGADAGPRGRLLATIVHFTVLPTDDAVANGRLMAAAPLLIEALARLLDEWGETERLSRETVQRATRAIVAAVDGLDASSDAIADGLSEKGLSEKGLSEKGLSEKGGASQ